ncbi:MAG: hypothetical protein KKB37_12580 [Alphaproteobacteria bacterium]|nr:hypothetical protein [Alphaproteobacteria bacterium]
MTGESMIDYEALAQDAMRNVVRSVLIETAEKGLPGDHHFYISFDTLAPGVILSKRLREKYAEEMTIVLQHRFWDLVINENRFEVKLTFDGIPERLVVPFKAIRVFFDPSVRYGLQFETATSSMEKARQDHHELDEAFDDPFAARDFSTSEPASSSNERDNLRNLTELTPQPVPRPKPARRSVDKDERSGDAPPAESGQDNENAGDKAVSGGGAEIVSLDAFRKK